MNYLKVHMNKCQLLISLWRVILQMYLTFKAPITTAADEKLCDIFLIFQQK